MNKRSIIFILTTILTTLCLLLCSCSISLEQRFDQMDKSIDECSSATVSITVTDNGVTVYSLERKVVITGNQAEVNTTEKKLNEEFDFQESSSSTTEQIEVVPHVTLTQDIVAFTQLNDDGIVCVVEKANAQKLFGTDVSVGGDIAVTCKFDAKQLVSVKCEFVSTSQKSVTILYTYGN